MPRWPKKDVKPASVSAPRKIVDVEDLPQPAATPAPTQPVAPSPAVLTLQQKVVDWVACREVARGRIVAAHAEYLVAQGKFQAAQSELQGIEQETQYLIGLIAQLENRVPQTPVLNFPIPGEIPVAVHQAGPYAQSLAGVTSEPAKPQTNYALGSADDIRKEIQRGMM